MKQQKNRPQRTAKAQMTGKEAIKIVSRHNLWRRGADIPMENPKELGRALEVVLRLARAYQRRVKRIGA